MGTVLSASHYLTEHGTVLSASHYLTEHGDSVFSKPLPHWTWGQCFQQATTSLNMGTVLSASHYLIETWEQCFQQATTSLNMGTVLSASHYLTEHGDSAFSKPLPHWTWGQCFQQATTSLKHGDSTFSNPLPHWTWGQSFFLSNHSRTQTSGTLPCWPRGQRQQGRHNSARCCRRWRQEETTIPVRCAWPSLPGSLPLQTGRGWPGLWRSAAVCGSQCHSGTNAESHPGLPSLSPMERSACILSYSSSS